MRAIDTHCHPQYFLSSTETSEVTQAAVGEFLESCFSELDNILMVGITLDDFSLLKKVAEHDRRAHMSVGIHPCHAHEKPLATELPRLREYASDPCVLAIGETGLDGYHSREHDQVQEDSFCAHLECAAEVGKPVIVHTRSAGPRTLDMLKAHSNVRGVIHCFTEDLDFARTVLDLGWMISFSGIITFPKASELRDVLKFIPRDALLVETDAPYLAPVPFRGKTNHPSYVRYVTEYVAQFLDWEYENFIRTLHQNYQNFLTINQQ